MSREERKAHLKELVEQLGTDADLELAEQLLNDLLSPGLDEATQKILDARLKEADKGDFVNYTEFMKSWRNGV